MSFSIKSAQQGRVNNAYAFRLHDTARHLSGVDIAPAGELGHDVLHRPVTRKNVDLGPPAPEHAAHISVQERIRDETNQLPMMPIGATGMRGHGDFAGLGRDNKPMNIYSRPGQSDYNRGRFVRHYNTCNNSVPDHAPARGTYDFIPQRRQWDRSHDAVLRHRFTG